jgi:hypothetical protein
MGVPENLSVMGSPQGIELRFSNTHRNLDTDQANSIHLFSLESIHFKITVTDVCLFQLNQRYLQLRSVQCTAGAPQLWFLTNYIQQNSIHPDAGYSDRQLPGSAWPFG